MVEDTEDLVQTPAPTNTSCEMLGKSLNILSVSLLEN